MGNPTRQDGRVEPGQRLSTAISARAWNRAQDAADVVLGERSRFAPGDAEGQSRAAIISLVRNNAGIAVPIFGVLMITGVEISPGSGEMDSTGSLGTRVKQFAAGPLLVGGLPDGGSNFAVAMEPIAAGAIGRMAVGGRFACKVKIVAEGHGFATSRNGDVTQLRTIDCGPVRLLWKSSPGDYKWAVGVM